MQINGTPEGIMEFYVGQHPELPEVLAKARSMIRQTKREVYPYQAAALYSCAKAYNEPGAQILELGTALGYSCAVIAQAAPLARIVTLNPLPHEVVEARAALRKFSNVEVIEQKSWEYLPFNSVQLSMIFVDADHKRVRHDLPYWNHLRVGGLMIHHDYSPEASNRACPPVFEALNDFAVFVGREPDVLVVDDQLVGLAGWIYQKDDPVYRLNGGHTDDV